MKAVVQRVRRAWVTVNETEIARIGPGALVLLGVEQGDTEQGAEWLADKTARLRIFNDAQGQLNASIDAVDGSFLVVSQFTLLGDCRKGNRPSYIRAAPPETANRLYEYFAARLREIGGCPVQTGRFREHMIVGLENDGPVTLLLERP